MERQLELVAAACGPKHPAALNEFCREVRQAWADVGETWPSHDSTTHAHIKSLFSQLCEDLRLQVSVEQKGEQNPIETPEILLVSHFRKFPFPPNDQWRYDHHSDFPPIQASTQYALFYFFDQLRRPERAERVKQERRSTRMFARHELARASLSPRTLEAVINPLTL